MKKRNLVLGALATAVCITAMPVTGGMNSKYSPACVAQAEVPTVTADMVSLKVDGISKSLVDVNSKECLADDIHKGKKSVTLESLTANVNLEYCLIHTDTSYIPSTTKKKYKKYKKAIKVSSKKKYCFIGVKAEINGETAGEFISQAFIFDSKKPKIKWNKSLKEVTFTDNIGFNYGDMYIDGTSVKTDATVDGVYDSYTFPISGTGKIKFEVKDIAGNVTKKTVKIK